MSDYMTAVLILLFFAFGYARGFVKGYRKGRRSMILPDDLRKWRQLLEPHIRKFELASKIDDAQVTYNHKGTEAMAVVLRETANSLDLAVKLVKGR